MAREKFRTLEVVLADVTVKLEGGAYTARFASGKGDSIYLIDVQRDEAQKLQPGGVYEIDITLISH